MGPGGASRLKGALLGGGDTHWAAWWTGGVQGRSKFRNLCVIFVVNAFLKRRTMAFIEGCLVAWGGYPLHWSWPGSSDKDQRLRFGSKRGQGSRGRSGGRG